MNRNTMYSVLLLRSRYNTSLRVQLKKTPQLKPDARYPMYKYISSGVNFDDGPLPII